MSEQSYDRLGKHNSVAAPSGAKLMATALAAGAFAVMLIFSAFAIYHDYSEHELRRKELDRYLDTVGAATSWGVDNWLTYRVSYAANLAQIISASDDGKSAVEIVRNPVYEQDFLRSYFGGVNGRFASWPVDQYLPADFDPRQQAWFSAALMAKRSTLTEPAFDPASNTQTMTVAAPIYRNGELRGVAGADFTTQSLNSILAKTNLGGLGYAFLVTGGGKILAHPDKEMVSRDIAFAYPGHRPVIGGKVQYLENMKHPQIVTFHKIPSLSSVDWYLALSVDKHAAYQSIYEFRTTAAAATLAAAILMVIILGFVIHRILVRPLINARAAADAANIAKSDFLASMSHEVRTPMNGVLGMAEVLANTRLDRRQQELATIIISSGNALMTVINDILDFAKLEAGKFRLSPRAFNLRQTVYEVAAMMQARARERGVELIVRYAPTLPDGVVADDSRLRQVLGNLIGNAVKFTERGYVLVDVSGERVGDELLLEVSVKDTGVGIAEDQIPRMFEKFEQADASHTRRFGGTGLGLAICRDIIDLMGGEIGAESALGEGARFWFSLRLPVDNANQSTPVVDGSIFNGVRVLAADDNPVMRAILREFFDAWGIRATLVEGAEQAMEALEKSVCEDDHYDALLLDDQMPGENGLNLAQRIQADARLAGAPVIILTSADDVYSASEITVDAVRIEAFLAKPLRPSQLLEALTDIRMKAAPGLLRNASLLRRSCETGGNNARGASFEPVSNDGDARMVRHQMKVLIAEDNIVNQMVMDKFIDGTRYEVMIAADGVSVIEMFKEHAPAIVLMDLSMPVYDGFEATAQIRAFEAVQGLARTPIIATTAHILDDDRARCRDAGMDDFLSKPMKRAALMEMLERWLDQAPASYPSKLLLDMT